MEKPARNIRLQLEYEGTGFEGFQRQPRGRTVEVELEKALRRLTGEAVRIIGASRTDAGVHALGQVVNFRTTAVIPAERIACALNGILPADIRILESCEAEAGFHARHDAYRKTYIYLIYRQQRGAVLYRHRAWLIFKDLRVEPMAAAARELEGTHDFSSFCASNSGVQNRTRTVQQCRLESEGPWLRLQITADGFLYHMVRNIIGTLVAVGQGKIPAEAITGILQSRERSRAGPTAPAQGLYLLQIDYPHNVDREQENGVKCLSMRLPD